jgi:hypothetical protein
MTSASPFSPSCRYSVALLALGLEPGLRRRRPPRRANSPRGGALRDARLGVLALRCFARGLLRAALRRGLRGRLRRRLRRAFFEADFFDAPFFDAAARPLRPLAARRPSSSPSSTRTSPRPSRPSSTSARASPPRRRSRARTIASPANASLASTSPTNPATEAATSGWTECRRACVCSAAVVVVGDALEAAAGRRSAAEQRADLGGRSSAPCRTRRRASGLSDAPEGARP